MIGLSKFISLSESQQIYDMSKSVESNTTEMLHEVITPESKATVPG